MDEQRIKAYLNLIQQLLQCPNGQEREILRANPELVNRELVQIMEAVAAKMAAAGNEDTANWLRNLAGGISRDAWDFLHRSFSRRVWQILNVHLKDSSN